MILPIVMWKGKTTGGFSLRKLACSSAVRQGRCWSGGAMSSSAGGHKAWLQQLLLLGEGDRE
jgi:hypothetical protein